MLRGRTGDREVTLEDGSFLWQCSIYSKLLMLTIFCTIIVIIPLISDGTAAILQKVKLGFSLLCSSGYGTFHLSS